MRENESSLTGVRVQAAGAALDALPAAKDGEAEPEAEPEPSADDEE